jgi:hypothetical protein
MQQPVTWPTNRGPTDWVRWGSVPALPCMRSAFDPVCHHAVCEALTWVFDGTATPE